MDRVQIFLQTGFLVGGSSSEIEWAIDKKKGKTTTYVIIIMSLAWSHFNRTWPSLTGIADRLEMDLLREISTASKGPPVGFLTGVSPPKD